MIESLGSIIKDFFRKLQIEPQLKEGRVLAGFPQILDPDLVGEVFPERVEKGVLYLQAKSSAGMNELKLRQKSLISPVVKGTVLGFGPKSYALGLEALIDLLDVQ
jgi:hypothetical protein